VGASLTNVLPDGLPLVWGVAVDPSTGYVYVSDMTSGLWIIDPQNEADPT
jgi:DNA-binding beta-propeller fold protein YncE